MIDIPHKILEEITHLTTDSNQVRLGSTFIAIKGTIADGHNFIQHALDNGAKTIICEQISAQFTNANFIQVTNSRLTYAMIQEVLYNFPSKKLDLIGITGTNGKTTTTHILQNLLGDKCASISTLGIKFQEKITASVHTTPDAAIIQQNLFELTKKNCQTSIIETSAHSLSQNRLGNMKFNYAIFTNLSQDHLDYYKTIENYFHAKSLLFSQHLSSNGIAIINGDNEYGKILCSQLLPKQYFSFGQQAHNHAQIIIQPQLLSINFQGKRYQFRHKFIADYNAYNLTAAILIACLKNISIDKIQQKLLTLTSCCGRLQQIKNTNIFIDYAHTPAALENVLKALKSTRKIHLIFGCGGDRDKNKRALMGEIATKYADIITITDDNPRSEKPQTIINDILKKVGERNNITITSDRYQAIAQAIDKYDSNTTLLIAGKGHETQQVYHNKTIQFNDYEIATKLINSKK